MIDDMVMSTFMKFCGDNNWLCLSFIQACNFNYTYNLFTQAIQPTRRK